MVTAKTAFSSMSLMVGACLCAVALGVKASAEGTHQFNTSQALTSSTTIYADVLNSSETINISLCSNATISIWNTNGTPSATGDDTQVINNAAFTANLTCGSALSNPITGAYEFTPGVAGTFRITFSSSQARYDFTVTANNTINPDPTISGGRIWSYDWNLSTGSFALSAATDADLYILVPAPVNGQSFVWKLDLNKFSGNAYQLKANNLGLDSPYSGISAAQADSSVTPQFPLYLGYPASAGTASTTTPNVTSANFIDSASEDNIFSPNATPGVQDTGNFTFTSNVDNANYAITVDTNQDSVYGTGDRLLLGNAVNGLNTVTWDGDYPNGSPVPNGVYTAQIQIRTGEYHFIASDVESSGGTSDGGTTWNNGLTIYRALDGSTIENTKVYWDDMTELSGSDYPTSNVPSGVTSGSMTDANSDGRADGFHTWGEFDSNGLGNVNNIDTYVYGPSDTEVVTIAVASSEAADDDGKPAAVEVAAPNNGDGNDDGTVDFLQDDVTSLPNPVIANAYNTIESATCSSLSNVDIYAESQLSANDTSFDYPVGLFNFSVDCLTPGATANITIYYDKVYNVATWTPRKFVNGQYSNITGASFGTATVGSTTVTTLSYTVTDGGPLDSDGSANGTIVDPVGPGVQGASTTAASPASKAPATGIKRYPLTISVALFVFGAMSFIVATLILGLTRFQDSK